MPIRGVATSTSATLADLLLAKIDHNLLCFFALWLRLPAPNNLLGRRGKIGFHVEEKSHVLFSGLLTPPEMHCKQGKNL